MDMIKHSKYFAYAKHEFYDELCEQTIELEDLLIKSSSKVVLDEKIQAKNIYGFHMKIAEIVKLINKNYHKF